MDEMINSKPRRFGAQFFVTVFLILLAAGAGAGAMWFMQIHKPYDENVKENSAMQMQLISNSADKLADQFTDADHDLLADPPTDPKQFIDPPTLTFCYVADDPEKSRDDWKPFCDHLSKVTGKPVEYLLVKSIQEQLKAMQDGKLQVSGLNTGAVPQAVNLCGFIPVCRVPTADPAGTHVEIIVPTSSPMMTLVDLKGHELTLTEPTSNSGYKAPMVLLSSDYSLQPERDYVIRMSSAHDASIAGIAKGDYQAAAVAADMLAKAEASGEITKEQFRSIYRSESFPSAALGYVYNLKPELAAKVKEAMMSFQAKGTPMEAVFSDGGDGKLVPVNYKNDWALIRRIDQESATMRGSK